MARGSRNQTVVLDLATVGLVVEGGRLQMSWVVRHGNSHRGAPARHGGGWAPLRLAGGRQLRGNLWMEGAPRIATKMNAEDARPFVPVVRQR